MKYFLLIPIRLYWILPKKYRRRCVFSVSCSQHVHTVTRKYGLASGWKALRQRVHTCKPGAGIIQIEDTEWVVLVDGSVVRREETNL